MHRYLLLCIAILTLQGCGYPRPNPSSYTNRPHTFRGGFGESFEYRDPLSVLHNPHGGSDRTFFSYGGTPVGAMVVCAPPPTRPDEVLSDVIIQSTKKHYAATEVSYQQVTNAGGHVLHHFSSDAHRNGVSYRYSLYLFFEDREFSNMAQSLMSKSFGTYRFEFVVPDTMYKTAQPHLDFVIETFKPPVDRGK